MPSNKDLVESIRKIDPDFPEDHGKNNGELSQHLKDLRAKAEAEAPAPAAVSRVAKGVAITSKKGVLADGAEVKASDLASPESFAALKEKGLIVDG